MGFYNKEKWNHQSSGLWYSFCKLDAESFISGSRIGIVVLLLFKYMGSNQEEI